MKSLWQWVIVATVVLLVPASASATVLTYYPGGNAASPSNDLGDLDHQFYYGWTITGIPIVPSGQQISSAYITFRNMYNWDNTANILYMDLLNDASSGGTLLSTNPGTTGGNPYTSIIRNARDSTQSPVTTFSDAFNGTSVLGANVGGTAGIDLTEHAFLPGPAINSIDNDPSQASDITWLQNLLTSAGLPAVDAQFGAANPQWTFAPSGGGIGWDYTYNFTTGQLGTLTSYINTAPSGTITLAFDPDCHFFNDGVSFTLVTGSISQTAAVPEPASLILLGTGLLFTAKRYRRRRAAKIPAQK